jgi:hypothetical protein
MWVGYKNMDGATIASYAEQLVEVGHFKEEGDALDWLLEAIAGGYPDRTPLMTENAIQWAEGRRLSELYPEVDIGHARSYTYCY